MTGNPISAWRNAENLPASARGLKAVIRVLIEHVRELAICGRLDTNPLTKGLLEVGGLAGLVAGHPWPRPRAG